MYVWHTPVLITLHRPNQRTHRTGSTESSTCTISSFSKARTRWKIPSTAAMCDRKAFPSPAPVQFVVYVYTIGVRTDPRTTTTYTYTLAQPAGRRALLLLTDVPSLAPLMSPAMSVTWRKAGILDGGLKSSQR